MLLLKIKCFNTLQINKLTLIMKSILENIKAIRNQKGLSQEFMASEIKIEQASYGLIENGKRQLKYKTLEQIAIIFKMPVIDIITYPDVFVRKTKNRQEINATLTIELNEQKREEVLRVVFGDENYKVLNK